MRSAVVKRRARCLPALLLAMAYPSAAAAAATCTVSATTLAFASYNPFSSSPLDSAGDIAVTCSLGGLLSLLVSYDIRLSTGGSAGYAPRRMSSGVNSLDYNLYTTSGRTTVWGNGTGTTAIISDGYLLGVGTTVRHYAVHGRVPALQNVRGGAYVDSITVTVDY